MKVPLDDNSVLAHPCDIVSPCALGNVSLDNLYDQIHNTSCIKMIGIGMCDIL